MIKQLINTGTKTALITGILMFGISAYGQTSVKSSNPVPSADVLGNPQSSDGTTLKGKSGKPNAAIVYDGKLKVKLIKQDSKIEVQLSFDGNEAKKGNLKIYNSISQLAGEFEINLKKSPEYHSLFLAEYSDGDYILKLTTAGGVHFSRLTIK